MNNQNSSIKHEKVSNKNRICWSLIQYEIRTIIGNPFIHFFGIGLPILLSILISKASTADYTDVTIIREISTSVFLGIGFIVPLATILIGYAATYSQDIEKGISLRMRLFGFRDKYILLNRIVAEFIVLTMAFIIYGIVGILFLELKAPAFSGLLIYLICIYVFSALMFMLAHAIAGLLKKFGLTYAVSMGLYFLFMILGGLMGLTYEQLPSGLQVIAKLLPLKYINEDSYTFWIGKSYNFVPMIQAYILLGTLSGILLLLSSYRSRRVIH